MKWTDSWVRRFGSAVLVGGLAACGGGGDGGTVGAQTDAASVRMEDGAWISFSDLANFGDVTVRVARDASSAPLLPQGVQPIGSVYRFDPVGAFAGNSEITVPFERSALPAGAVPKLYYAAPNSEGQIHWMAHVGATHDGAQLRAQVPHLGFAVVGVDGLAAGHAGVQSSREAAQAASAIDPPASAAPIAVRFDPPHATNSTLTTNNTKLGLSVQYALPDCSSGTRITVRASHLPPGPTSTRTFDLRTVEINSSAPFGAVAVSQNMTSADNGTWTYSASVKCALAAGGFVELLQSGPSIAVNMNGDLHPRIADLSKDVSTVFGESVALSVRASGSNVTYQWQASHGNPEAFVNIGGAKVATYAFTAPSVAGSTYYRVVASNKFGVVWSQPIRVTVTERAQGPVSVVSDPASQTVTEGQTASFTVVGSGTPAPKIQWQGRRGALPQAEDGWSDIAGATSATYTTPRVAMGDSGRQYRAVLLSAAGSATSRAATLTVTQRLVPATITGQPGALSVKAGMAAAFSVDADGTAPIHYQWFKNGVAIAGANASAVLIGATTAEIGQTHRITVSVANAAGAATSSAAAMAVVAPEGGEFVAATVDAATGGVLETSTGAAVVVPAGALASNARVTVLAEKADQVGLPTGFIAVSDVFTVSTGGVAITPDVTLNVPAPESMEEGRVLALVELGETAGIVGFGAFNVERLAGGAINLGRSMAMASTPATRVMCLDASHARFGTTVVRMDRVARYMTAQVPESACTGNAPRPTRSKVPSTATEPCRPHDFVHSSAGALAALVSRHVYCETGSIETRIYARTNQENVPDRDLGDHVLEYRFGIDGPAIHLKMNARVSFRLVPKTGAADAAAQLALRPVIECASGEGVGKCTYTMARQVTVKADGRWSDEILMPVGFSWPGTDASVRDYAFKPVSVVSTMPGYKTDTESQTLYIGQPPNLRCDRFMDTGQKSSGCVFADYPAVMLMPLSDPRWMEAAQHINDAQAMGSPGALEFDAEGLPVTAPGNALQRYRFGGEASRAVACRSQTALINIRLPKNVSPSCNTPETEGICSCDEYPFGASWNGALFDPVRTSVKMINAKQNSQGGSLYNSFTQHERVIDLSPSPTVKGTADNFWIHID